jgi:hypothetical protein
LYLEGVLAPSRSSSTAKKTFDLVYSFTRREVDGEILCSLDLGSANNLPAAYRDATGYSAPAVINEESLIFIDGCTLPERNQEVKAKFMATARALLAMIKSE